MDDLLHADPLEPRRGGSRRSETRRGGFKTVELNAIGWSALAGVGTAVGTAASLAIRAPLLGSIATGLVGTWAVAVGLDRRRWRNATAHISRGDLTEEAYRRAVDRLRADGIDASYLEIVDEESGEIHRAIECREADAEAVSAVLEELKTGPT